MKSIHKIIWSKNLAYAIGLITTDGNLSIDGRHLSLTSKDVSQLRTFAKILKLKNKIGRKKSTYKPEGTYYHIQFGNKEFYKFLLSIGLTPHKSKTVGKLKIPDEYFVDFLRGHLDGDGYTCSYWSKTWRNSLVFYTYFISASEKHIVWLKENIFRLYKIAGRVTFQRKTSVFRLAFAKKNSVNLLSKLYYKKSIPCLLRKRKKIDAVLGIIQKQADVAKRNTR